jgi:predicted ATPase
MFLQKIELLNIWGEKSISVEFKKNVSFLIGENGVGKTTVLKLISDIFNSTSVAGSRTKSPMRFWSGKATFESGDVVHESVFPLLEDQQKLDPAIERLQLENGTYHSNVTLKEVESLYRVKQGVERSFIGDSHTMIIKQPSSLLDGHTFAPVNIDEKRSFNPLFISDTSIVSTFDEVCDQFRVYENNLNIDLIKMFEDTDNKIDPEQKKKVKAVKSDLDNLFKLLDKMFEPNGKKLVRNDELEPTLQYIGDASPMPHKWLNDKEKAIISLFVTVFLKRETVDLFLLDSIENGMHISWHRQIVKSLSVLAPNSQFVFATHSPGIVSGCDKSWSSLEVTEVSSIVGEE